jgi:hypothetical protein
MKRDIWTLLAAFASFGFLGWVVVATPNQSALKGDPDRPFPVESSLLRVSQDSPHMRNER